MLTTESFARTVREKSMAGHEGAEHSPFMAALTAGELTRAEYAGLVVQLRAIYSSLDSAAGSLRGDPTVGAFFDPSLDRTKAIAADLRFLGTEGAIGVTDATARYTARIDEVAKTWPAGVVAHHYTRYLGDLSGGRVLAKYLAEHLQLTPARGLAFYDFSELGSAPAFKTRYREMLDAVTWDGAERSAFIDEVLRAYRFNTEVLAALDPKR